MHERTLRDELIVALDHPCIRSRRDTTIRRAHSIDETGSRTLTSRPDQLDRVQVLVVEEVDRVRAKVTPPVDPNLHTRLYLQS